jgi:hypothetical protein
MSNHPSPTSDFEQALRRRASRLIADGDTRHDFVLIGQGHVVNTLAGQVPRLADGTRDGADQSLRASDADGRSWRAETLDHVLASELEQWSWREVTAESVAIELIVRLADSPSLGSSDD